MAPSMFIAGSVDSLATNLQSQPAYIHMTCNLPVRRVLIYGFRQLLTTWEVRYWMSPVPLWLVLPSFFPVTYLHQHLCPNLQTPIILTSAVRSIRICDMAIPFIASHIGRIIGGGTPSSVLSCLNFSERTYYEHLFDPPAIHDPYWVKGAIGPYDYDLLRNASFHTHLHLIIIADACGLDNDTYLLLFGDQPRTSTYSTGGRRGGIDSLLRIRRVLAGKPTSSMAYLALNACHGPLQAINACYGSPKREINFI
eukprot:6184064-Pleurochrysis_carterae.AAC.1